MKIVDYYQHSHDGVVFPLRFIPHDGYYPLMSIPVQYKGYDNPYFKGMHNRRIDCRISNKVNLKSAGRSLIYRKGRTWGGPYINLFSGFYSVIASSQDFDYMPSSLFGDDVKYRMKGEIDIFCLGMVKLTELPTITVVKESYLRYVHKRKVMRTTLDLTKVKILVNKEKLRKSLFTKENYTTTVRKIILDQIKLADTQSAITVEDVSDEYLRSFIVSPNTVRTNSMTKVIQMNNEIKDSVFSNLNTVLV